MVGNIRKLSKETQSLLKIASCIGNRFYLDTIIRVSGDSPALIQRAFVEALREGLLILRGGQTFLIDDKVHQYSRNALKEAVGNNNIEPIVAEFVHDRVQQAAYSIILKGERTETHIKLGRQMLSRCAREQIEDNLFDIVDQFNRGLQLLSEDDEKQRLVQLNLWAGKKAAESAAYKNAVSYFDAAIDVLDPDSWNSDHALTWELYYRKAECEFSSALLEECEETVKNTLIRCKKIDEQVVFYQIQLKLLFQATRHFEAIEVIREVLKMLGVRLPRTIKKRHIAWQFIKFNIALGGRKPWQLLDQPEIEDRHQLNICAVIYDSIPSTYMVNPDIMGYLSLIMANICLRFGNSIYAPFAFAMIPVVMVGVTKQYQTAYDYSMMAIKLNEKFPSLDAKARIYFLAGFFSLHWVKPIRDHIPLWQTAYQCTLEAGNLHWHNYCVTFTRPQSVLFNNQGLDDIEAVNKDFYEMHMRSKDREVSLNQLFVLTFVESLRKTENDRLQSPYDFDEQKYAAEMVHPGNYLIRAYYYGFNLVRDFVFEDYHNAQKNGEHAMRVVHEVLGNLSEFVIRFFYLLTLLRIGQKLSLWQRFKLIGPYWKNKILLWHSARNCPENFLPQYTLLLAEEARVRGKDANAPILYEKAIQLARKSNFPLFTALSNELAAKYYQERGVETITTGYINEAFSDYASWGALAKTEALKKRYPEIFKSMTAKGETDSSSMDALDLASAIKASRAISSEIKLPSLLNRLMQIIIENAGAQRGLLVIVTEDEMKIEAVADIQSDELNVLQSIPVVDSTHLPVTLVRYVKRTGENVVLGNAGSDVNYINDPYIANHKPKSIICTPISYHDKVSGILYLENNSAASAFTQEHINMLSILLPQMAISLGNAKLFEETRQAQIALGNSNRDLYKTKQYLESLINNANVWLNVLDTEGNVVIWNKAAEKISGFTSDEVLGNNNIWKWAYPDERYRNEIQTKASEIINRGEEIENFETTIQRKDQEARVISWHSRNLSDENGNPVGSIAIGRDVTKTKLLEEQLAQAHKMEAVGTLASGIAHDFNNLLQVVTGYSQMLLTTKDQSDPDFSGLGSILQAGKRAAKLVQQLLLFSRKATTEQKPVELNLEVEKIRKLLERTIPKMITIELHLQSQLWKVKADPMQVEQILLNLGSNAADAMPEGGTFLIETKNVTLDDDSAGEFLDIQPGKYVLIRVSDTGQGMDKQIVERIFEPFFTTKGVGKGTGLGLASVYGIVRNHGGHISCNSKTGKGTVFDIYLPVAEQMATVQQKDPASKPTEGGTELILLVDDEEDIRNLASRVLERQGYSILTASSGEEALTIYAQKFQEIGLVILDIGMPGMGGYNCLKEIMRTNASAKIVVASGYSVDGLVKEALEAGAAGYIGKPYNLTFLLDTVRNVLDDVSV